MKIQCFYVIDGKRIAVRFENNVTVTDPDYRIKTVAGELKKLHELDFDDNCLYVYLQYHPDPTNCIAFLIPNRQPSSVHIEVGPTQKLEVFYNPGLGV